MADNRQDLSKRLLSEEQAELIYEQSEAVLHYLGQRIDALHGQEIRERLHLTEEEIVFTEVAQRRVLKKLKAVEKAQRKALAPAWQKAAKRILRTCAMVLLAVLILNSVLVVTVEAYREKVFELFTIDGEKATELFWKEKEPEREASYESMTDAEQLLQNAFGKEHTLWYPEYLPEGYTLKQAGKTGGSDRLIFRNAKNEKLVLDQCPAEYTKYLIDTENGPHFAIKINGKEAMCFELGAEKRLLAWERGGCVLDLIGTISLDEMISVAEKIKLKKI